MEENEVIVAGDAVTKRDDGKKKHVLKWWKFEICNVNLTFAVCIA